MNKAQILNRLASLRSQIDIELSANLATVRNLRAIEESIAGLWRELAEDSGQQDESPIVSEVEQICRNSSNKIHAIKNVRERFGYGLVYSKHLVDLVWNKCQG